MTPSAILRKRTPATVGVAVVVALGAAACGGSGSGTGGEDAGRAAGPPAAEAGDLPATELQMSDGTTVTLPELLDGRPLVVNYFASWCAPCRAEMPELAAVHGELGSEVDFFGVALQDVPEASADLVDETGVEYPWASDTSGSLFAELGGFAMPTTFYVSADGEILDQDNGPIDESALRDRLDDLFGVTS